MSDHKSGMPGVVTTSLWILGIIVVLMIGLTIYSRLTDHVTVATATIDGRTHQVLVASTPTSRYQGLSGKTVANLGAEGMYFSFSDDAERTFVMRGMLFNLDFLWVRDGKIVKVDLNVPAPKGGEAPKFVYSKPESADGVFEFPAGFVARNGVSVGDIVKIK
jgi:uncharacterized membrane protein (UPF0127 family)